MSQSRNGAAIIAAILILLPPIVSSLTAAPEPTKPASQTQQSTTEDKTGTSETTTDVGQKQRNNACVIPTPVEVVVTATRTVLPTREVASSTTVITSREIDQKQANSVVEALRNVPAVDVVQSGGPGQHASVFIRGGQSEHTLLLIDGIEMNDPISAGRSYEFEHLTTDNVDQVEIIRGPQSTLYGSDAIGGVINIITKKGNGPFRSSFSAQAGSYATFREKATMSGSTERLNYSLGVSRTDSDGISAADQTYGNLEKDGLGNSSISTRLGIAVASNMDIDFIAGLIDATTDIDTFGGVGGDDPNSVVYYRQMYLRTQGRLTLVGGLWEQKFGISVADHDRHYHDEFDDQHPHDRSDTTFNSRMLKADWQTNLYLRDINTLTFGLETEDEEGRSDFYSETAWGPYRSSFDSISARTTGVFLQDQSKVGDAWLTTVGVRRDDHSEFGSKTTYRIASAYLIPRTGTKIRGTYGTGFKAPSLYQLFSQYGDKALKPEESTGWDFGVEQYLFQEKVTSGITYFSNKFSNLIDFDSATSKYMNIAQADASGVEIFAGIQPTEILTLKASYTLTDTRDRSTGTALLRRPRHKCGFDINSRLHQKTNIHVSLTYVGKREDTDSSTWPSTPVTMDAHTLVNLATTYDIGRGIQIFGRVDNLFNMDYEEVFGYGTPGISFYGGASIVF